MSGTTCKRPGGFGRVPIVTAVPKLTRSLKSNSWLVNMLMCVAVLINVLSKEKLYY